MKSSLLMYWLKRNYGCNTMFSYIAHYMKVVFIFHYFFNTYLYIQFNIVIIII